MTGLPEIVSAIVLDCDGVIFKSNELKLQAFDEVAFNAIGTVPTEFTAYVKANFGKSRYHFFEYFVQKYRCLNAELDVNTLLKKYSKICEKLYLECDTTPHLLTFLKTYQKIDKFVVSGSDQAELRDIFRKRELTPYFVEVFGSPRNKVSWIEKIKETHSNVVVIGDAYSDFNAARETNSEFIFMNDFAINPDLPNKHQVKTISNLGDLIKW